MFCLLGQKNLVPRILMEFIPYFLVFLLVAAIGVGETSNLKTFDKHATFFLLLVPLVALATFRPVGVGSDDVAYVDIFFRIPSILDCQLTFCGYDYSEIQVEPGFFGLLSMFHRIQSLQPTRIQESRE